jgi:hypothetical protein
MVSTNVDFPDPEAPMIAQKDPLGRENETPFNVGRLFVLYVKLTSSNSIDGSNPE